MKPTTIEKIKWLESKRGESYPWTEYDEKMNQAIIRTLQAVEEFIKKAKEIDSIEDPEFREYEADEFVRDFIKDFGEEGK